MRVFRFRDRFGVVSDAARDSRLSDGAHRMLCVLLGLVGPDGWVRNTRVEDLADCTGTCVRTATYRLTELHDCGYIERRLLGSGHPAAYRVLCLIEGWRLGQQGCVEQGGSSEAQNPAPPNTDDVLVEELDLPLREDLTPLPEYEEQPGLGDAESCGAPEPEEDSEEDAAWVYLRSHVAPRAGVTCTQLLGELHEGGQVSAAALTCGYVWHVLGIPFSHHQFLAAYCEHVRKLTVMGEGARQVLREAITRSHTEESCEADAELDALSEILDLYQKRSAANEER